MLRLRKNQSGQGMTEYIIIVAVIAIAAIAAFSYFGKTVRTQTAAMSDSLAGEGAKAVTESGNAATAATAAEGEAAKDKGLKDYTAGQVND
jgi:Flp pilus assembly pilin Flp